MGEDYVNEVFRCDCNSISHVIGVWYWRHEKEESDEPYEMFLSFLVTRDPRFFYRAWKALKYIFGSGDLCEQEIWLRGEAIDRYYDAIKRVKEARDRRKLEEK